MLPLVRIKIPAGWQAEIGEGGAPMMSAAECSKRAAECLNAAQSSSSQDEQRAWRRLSEAWTAWSQTLGPLTDPDRIYVPFPRIERHAPADSRFGAPTRAAIR